MKSGGRPIPSHGTKLVVEAARKPRERIVPNVLHIQFGGHLRLTCPMGDKAAAADTQSVPNPSSNNNHMHMKFIPCGTQSRERQEL